MNTKPKKTDAMKAIEAAAVLLRLESTKRMGRLRLLKLLYIANRRALREMGRPLLASQVVAMRHGPVHSEVYNLIKENHPDANRWATYISTDGPRIVHLTRQPPLGKLSRAEVDILQAVSNDHAHLDDWDVVELTHTFAEWDVNYPNKEENTSRPIPMDQLVQFSAPDHAQAILESLADEEDFDRLFAS